MRGFSSLIIWTYVVALVIRNFIVSKLKKIFFEKSHFTSRLTRLELVSTGFLHDTEDIGSEPR